MREAFDKVRHACEFGAVVPVEAAVGVVGGRLQAANSKMRASVPVDLPDFSVPAIDLDLAMRKLGDCTVSVTPATITLKGAAGTSRIKQTMAAHQFERPKDIDTHPIEDIDDLMGAIDDVYPFTTGDASKPWSFGARFDDRTVTATNGLMLCQAKMRSASGLTGVTVSRIGLSYMSLRRAELKAWGASPRGILVDFTDGSWALISRLSIEMPDSAVALVDRLVPDAAFGALKDVSPEYREKVMAAVDHTEETLAIYADHIFGARRASDHKCWVDTELGDGIERALFHAKLLTAVVSKARKIGFDHYPRPVPFITERGSRGLLAGKTE